MSKKFIELKLGSHAIVHGFDDEHQEIQEAINVKGYTTKLVAISRIKSISEKYILTDYAHGRWIYWEYEGSLETIKRELNA